MGIKISVGESEILGLAIWTRGPVATSMSESRHVDGLHRGVGGAERQRGSKNREDEEEREREKEREERVGGHPTVLAVALRSALISPDGTDTPDAKCYNSSRMAQAH